MGHKFKILQKIGKIIWELDRLIFEENSLVKEKELTIYAVKRGWEEDAVAGYGVTEENKEAYGFPINFDLRFKNGLRRIKKFRKKLRFFEDLKYLQKEERGREKFPKIYFLYEKYQILLPRKKKDYLVEVASHEVRHRVQKHLGIGLFSPEDEKRARNSYLKGIIEIVKEQLEKKMKRMSLEKKRKDFDAYVIEKLASKKWRETKDLKAVAEIIRADAQDLLKREKI